MELTWCPRSRNMAGRVQEKPLKAPPGLGGVDRARLQPLGRGAPARLGGPWELGGEGVSLRTWGAGIPRAGACKSRFQNPNHSRSKKQSPFETFGSRLSWGVPEDMEDPSSGPRVLQLSSLMEARMPGTDPLSLGGLRGWVIPWGPSWWSGAQGG